MDARRLREETRAEHEATEGLMPLTGPDLTVEVYARVLRVLLPVVRGWERWAAEAAPARLQGLLAARRRSHLIEADLEALGVGGAEEREAPVDWAAVVSGEARGGPDTGEAFEAGFMGAMYVMEGSTLGGRYIARHVESVLGLEPGRGDAYFQGHGESTGAMWREVTAQIAAVPEEQAEAVIGAARRTFVAFGEALRDGLFAGARAR